MKVLSKRQGRIIRWHSSKYLCLTDELKLLEWDTEKKVSVTVVEQGKEKKIVVEG